MARIISQIGDQLISNEEVALLELIKNSYDARVDDNDIFVSVIIDQVDNIMIIEDNGKGMTLDQLKSNWLIIGTTNRYEQKQELINSFEINETSNDSIDYVPLGEKGLGRFSTKKLGNKLRIETKSKNEKYVNIIEIDWTEYSYSSNKFLDEVVLPIWQEPCDNNNSFTKLIIQDLKKLNTIDYEYLRKLIIGKISKFTNPFKVYNTNQVGNLIIDFEILLPDLDKDGNVIGKRREVINLGEINQNLLEQAHFKIYGYFDGKKVRYNCDIMEKGDMKYHRDDASFPLDNIQNSLSSDEGKIGSFDFEIFFYNRRRLSEIKGFGNTAEVRTLLDNFCGGVMVYRDGFRVLPYGNSDNDWLKQNTDEMLRRNRTRFYTIQTTGYINISSLRNKNLIDQTNRQGLQENEAYVNLVFIMQSIIRELALINNELEDKQKDVKKKDSIETSRGIVDETINKVKNLEDNIKQLKEDSGITHSDMFGVLIDINDTVQDIKENVLIFKEENEQVRAFSKDLKDKEEMLFYLSAMGMVSEMVIHELHHAISDCNNLINNIQMLVQQSNVKQSLMSLSENIKSIREIISRIDDHSVTNRRVKVSFNLVEELKHVLINRKYELNVKFKNGKIKDIVVSAFQGQNSIKIKANKGMVLQLFINLIKNSIYWLNVFCESKDDFYPQITIEYENGKLYLYDNGFGIQDIDKDRIFEPFFSRKIDGRGLGLYIVKEICSLNNINIELTNELNEYGKYYRFCIDITNIIE